MKNFLKNKMLNLFKGKLLTVGITIGVFSFVFLAAANANAACTLTSIDTPANLSYISGASYDVTISVGGADTCGTDGAVFTGYYLFDSDDDGDFSDEGSYQQFGQISPGGDSTSYIIDWDTTPRTEGDNTRYKIRVVASGGATAITLTPAITYGIDNTSPVLSSAVTADDDADGKIDRVRVALTEAIGMAATCGTTGWTVTADGTEVLAVTSCTKFDINHLDLALTEDAGATTEDTPAVAYNSGTGDTTDQALNEITTGTIANATDGAKPAVVITDNDAGTVNIADATVTFTFTFSESVTGFDADDVTTTNGAEAVVAGGPAIYTLVVTPTAGYEGNVTVAVPAGGATDGTNTNAVSNTDTQPVDMLAPVGYTVNLNQTYANLANETAVSFTFAGAESGATYNYSINDTDGGTPAITGTGTIVTATDTVTGVNVSSLADETLTITVTLTDLSDNVGLGATDTIIHDSVAPTAPTAVAVLAIGGTPIVNTLNTTNTNMTASATITADQAVGGSAELLVGGASFSSTITDVEIAGGETGVTFTAGAVSTTTLQAAITAGGVISVRLTDAAGNSTVSTVGNPTLVVDYIVPTITSVLPAASTSIKTQTVSYTLSEAAAAASGVIVFTRTGGTADAAVHNCVLQGTALDSGVHTNLTLATNANACVAWPNPLVDGTIYTATFNSSDAAGNPAVQVSNTLVTYDTTAPTLEVGNIVGTSITGANDTIVVTFSEPVVAADGTWSINEFEVISQSAHGAITLTSATYSYLGNALTITLNETTDFEYLTNGETINFNPGTDMIKDLGGTSLATDVVSGTTGTTGDVTGPTVALTYSPDQAIYKEGDAVTITATFNELMDETDVPTIAIDAAGGAGGDTPATIMVMTSNMVWTYAWTVPAGSDGTATMTIAATDYAGNNNQAATNATKVIDNTKPTISALNVNDAAINAANAGVDAFVVTIDFNDTMAATAPTVVFDPLIDTTMTNCAGVWTDTDTYTYTCDVVDANLESANIDVNVSGAVDDGGNTMLADVGASGNSKFSVDTISPTAPTAVTFTATGGTVVADYVNNTNTNFTGGATIVAGEATDGSANWYIGGVAFATPINDATVLVGDTTLVFNAGLAGNGAVQAQIAAGSRTLSVRLCDLAGNCTTSSAGDKTITADYTNPASAATIANALYGSTTYVANTVNGTASDASGVSGVTVTIQEGAGNYWDGNSWEVGVTNLPAVGTSTWTYNSGTAITHTDSLVYTVTPTATDTAGNSVAGTADTYTWDGTIPTISNYNSNKVDGSYKAGVVIDVDVTFSEAVTTASAITLTLNSGGTCVIAPFSNSATATCDYTVGAGQTSADLTVSGFAAAGAVTDQAGNIMASFDPTGNNLAANKAFIIDTTAPVVNMGTEPGTKAVTWSQNTTVTETNTIGLVHAWTAILEPYTVTFGTAAAEDTTISAAGIGYYTVQLTATDLAGNVGTGTISFTWTSTNVPISSYSPINGATGVAIAAGNDSITFGGSENITLIDATKVTIVKDSDGSDVANGAVSVSGGNNATKILLIPHDAFENNTVYRINILAGAVRDASGHINSDGVSYFTTVAVAGDVTSPTLTTITPTTVQTTGSVAPIVFTFADGTAFDATAANNVVEFKMDGGTVAGVPVVSGAGDTVLTITYTNAALGVGVHNFNVRVKDLAGNFTISSAAIQVASSAPAVITAVAPTAISTTTATIGWTTDVTSTSNIVEYGLTSALGSTNSTDVGTTAHSAALTGLTAGSTYYYRVKSTVDGVIAYSDTLTFTTSVQDTGVAASNIQMIKSYATTDETYANGWKWSMDVTVYNIAETGLKMKFTDWMSGTSSIAILDNMRIGLTNEASAANDATIIAATKAVGNAYTDQATVLNLVDSNPNLGGIQDTIYLYMEVPAGSAGGAYSTQYGISTIDPS